MLGYSTNAVEDDLISSLGKFQTLFKMYIRVDRQSRTCKKTSSKPSKMRYLKAAKLQHIKLKNLYTD